MSDTPGAQPPGWYQAQGDPPGTQRWWDGNQWVGGPQPSAVQTGLPQQPAPWAPQGSPSPGGMPYGMQPGAAYGEPGYLPELGKVLGSPWRRIGARLLDTLIVGVPSLIIVLLLGADGVQSAGYGFARLAIGALYEIGFVSVKGGTPGKLILGLRVCTQDTGQTPPSTQVAVMRWLPNVADLIPLLSFVVGVVSLVFLFSDDRHRTINDRIAKTYVVRVG
jgi:uncharacterized RDD family membrane protein YckC